jgi:excisionase family DNA binding protein
MNAESAAAIDQIRAANAMLAAAVRGLSAGGGGRSLGLADPVAKELRASAASLSKSLRGLPDGPELVTPRSLGLEDMLMPRELLAAAPEALRRQAAGEAVKVQVLGEHLMANEAAELLGVSRPHLNMLLDRERIPYTKTAGGHRRISRKALEGYQARMGRARDLMGRSASAEADLADDD